jgi:hypothetical protein
MLTFVVVLHTRVPYLVGSKILDRASQFDAAPSRYCDILYLFSELRILNGHCNTQKQKLLNQFKDMEGS